MPVLDPYLDLRGHLKGPLHGFLPWKQLQAGIAALFNGVKP